MINTPKVVLMTAEELENLIQNSVRIAISEQLSKSSFTDDKPLTIEEASAFLQIPKATLYIFTSKREIPFHKMGKKILFFKADLLAWIAEGKKKTKKEIEQEGFVKIGKGGMR
jgi:excisionase family DNA binding protein